MRTQKLKNTGNSNYYGSVVRSEGVWPSSPHVDRSLNLFLDSMGDNKIVTARSVPSGFASPVSLMPNIQAEKGTKSDASVGCRLFGINLITNSTIVSPDREPTCLVMASSIDRGSTPVSASEADKAQINEVSKLLVEQKITSEAPPRMDTQGKQGSSSRSRTKVKNVSS